MARKLTEENRANIESMLETMTIEEEFSFDEAIDIIQDDYELSLEQINELNKIYN